MLVTVKYFGVIAEKTGVPEENLNLKITGTGVRDIKAYCLDKYQSMKNLTFQIAINQVLTTEGSLKEGDEIAILPPFSGG